MRHGRQSAVCRWPMVSVKNASAPLPLTLATRSACPARACRVPACGCARAHDRRSRARKVRKSGAVPRRDS
jgi:hypothetical protein